MTNQLNPINHGAKVLQVGPLPPGVRNDLHREFSVVELPATGVENFLAQHSDYLTVAVTSGMTGVGAAVMQALPKLRAIINFGVGYETTDIAVANDLKVIVSNTPDVLTDCVADLAVGLTLDTVRRITAADRFIRQGEWLHGAYPLAQRLKGKKVGIVGLGRIGQAIAERLTVFGCEISYHTRRKVDAVGYSWYQSLQAMAIDCEVLVVAVAAGPATNKLISRDVLEGLGSTGYLINISRGSVVDEQALVEMLHHKTLAGAGLDVFVDEPKVPEALLSLDNVVLTPHIGSATVGTRDDMAKLFMANLRQFLTDGTVLTPVN